MFDDIRMIWFDLDETLWDHTSTSRAALLELRSLDDRFRDIPYDRWIGAYEEINERLWSRVRKKHHR